MPNNKNNNFDYLLAEIIDTENPLQQHGFIQYLAIDEITLKQYIDYEIIVPVKQAQTLCFDQHCMRRGKIARRLQMDLSVNPEGIVIILDLLERLQSKS